MSNTISYKDLKDAYLNNEYAINNAKIYFTGKNEQPSIYRTGFYSAPSWNWGYHLGIVTVHFIDENAVSTTKSFEVVTQFGTVEAAREVMIPVVIA